MGVVQRAVLEFDEEVQAPWRPRLVVVSEHVMPAHDRSDGPRRTASPSPAARRPAARAVEPVRATGPRGHAVQRPVRVARPTRGRAGGVAPSARPAGAHHRPALRLTRRARRLIVVLVLALAVLLGALLAPLLAGDPGLRLAGDRSVVVQPGDSLWSIASSLEGAGDVRRVIDEIQELNGLAGGQLQAGQVLVLP